MCVCVCVCVCARCFSRLRFACVQLLVAYGVGDRVLPAMELHISDEETLHESLQLFINMRDHQHFIASLARRGILERVYEILDFNIGRSAKVRTALWLVYAHVCAP